jgi:flagellar FliJ protein
MKKFRFPLRSVATVRGLAELKARERFSLAVQAFATAEQRLKAARTRLQEHEKVLRDGRSGAFRAADQVGFLRAYKEETDHAATIEAEAVAARSAMETARQAWLESRRDVRVIENLEAKARLAHRAEVERESQNAMDDRASALAARAAAAQP